jgi:hypothetical protein
MKRGKRKICVGDRRRVSIWGIKGCGEIKSIRKCLIGGQMVVENG